MAVLSIFCVYFCNLLAVLVFKARGIGGKGFTSPNYVGRDQGPHYSRNFFDRELYSLGPSTVYGHHHPTLSNIVVR